MVPVNNIWFESIHDCEKTTNAFRSLPVERDGCFSLTRSVMKAMDDEVVVAILRQPRGSCLGNSGLSRA
jgi:hypothetical protein